MIFFLAGVHGVGKTSLSSRLSDKLKIPTISAGALIQKNIKHSAWPSDKKTKEIPHNQLRLISAVQSYQLQVKDFILDGHFSLLNESGEIISIEVDVFDALKLSGIIFIEDEPREIAARLEARDKVSWDVDLITALQQSEKKVALQLRDTFNLPLLITEPKFFDSVYEFIVKVMKISRSESIEGMR
ncbi:adenylate kinase [Pseudomonas sp. JAI111]|uniref:ATP-binding protein n=1 Tax=Pseudomonas sp. JAI111 TaxID=2735913 RepID=UPI002169328F|nr:ATP-binding protein [Pseudomonas sp. JAI111]MCS3841101.1 adenylate kinase [Pseudomonas sp. JAI111]